MGKVIKEYKSRFGKVTITMYRGEYGEENEYRVAQEELGLTAWFIYKSDAIRHAQFLAGRYLEKQGDEKEHNL